jgi:hypothetical protein
MGNLFESMDQIETPDDERAALVLEAWTKARREHPAAPSPACLSPTLLLAFSAGRVSTKRARDILLHLASCSLCRTQEMVLRKQRLLQPVRVIHLLSLRRAANQNAIKAKPIVDDVRRWLTEILTRAPVPEPTSLMAAILDAAGQPAGQAEFEMEAPATIDRHGRLRLALFAITPVSELHLTIAVQDSEQLLEFCIVPVKEGRAQAIVDCAFLQIPEGVIPPALLHLTLVLAEAAKGWDYPRILPTLERLRRVADPVEFWDAATALFVTHGDQWKEALRAEITQLESLSDGLVVVQSTIDQMNRYVEMWLQGNREVPSQAKEYLTSLSEIMEITQPPRKKPVKPQMETTIAQPRGKVRQRSPDPSHKEEESEPMS